MTMYAPAPEGFTDAQWHRDAITDSGDGYTAQQGWIVSCLWCQWVTVAPTKREAVEQYRAHERAAQAESS